MKLLIPAVLALTATGASAQLPKRDYPSCNLPAQRALKGDTGGSITDMGQAHISVRANILQADISTARKAHQLTQAKADTLWRGVDMVRRNTDAKVNKNGLLRARDQALYDRKLDAIAKQMCR